MGFKFFTPGWLMSVLALMAMLLGLAGCGEKAIPNRTKESLKTLTGEPVSIDELGAFITQIEATKTALSAAKVEFVVLRGCGHFWQECPDEFFSRVRAFLELPPAP